MGNNNFLLIEADIAVHQCADYPATHANPILLGIVTATDNHLLDEPFPLELIHLNMVMESLEGGFLIREVIDKAICAKQLS